MALGDLSILDAIDNPSLWAGWFKRPETWWPWRVFLSTLFGLPIDAAGLKLFCECTGRDDDPPRSGFLEAWLICGRRAGKSFMLALVAVFLAVFKDWRPCLSPGEVACVKIVACDRKQARTIHRYCRALLTKVPAFADLIERDTDDEIALTNSVVIEVQTASFRGARSYTIIAALLDEFAYVRTDEFAANPDVEILAAIRPSMATVPGAMLLVASSPYARRGAVFDAFREHHGQPSDVLVWKAPTRTMNPTVPQRFIDREVERDPARAAAEYGAEFRTDIEGFVSREVVDAAVVPGRHELPRVTGIRYVAAVDPSGSGSDAMTLAITHRDTKGNAILDVVRERRPPFSPEAVVAEFAAVCKAYGVTKVTGDHWGGEFVREPFRKLGIIYALAERPKSDFYFEFLPILNSARVELLDHPRFISQLCTLERRTARSGKDSIDHPPGGHDDLVNVVAIAVVLAAAKHATMILSPAALKKSASMPYTRQRFGALGPLDGGRGRNRFGRSL